MEAKRSGIGMERNSGPEFGKGERTGVWGGERGEEQRSEGDSIAALITDSWPVRTVRERGEGALELLSGS